MFCNRAYYALVLMITLAQHYGGKNVGIQEVARTHDLPVVAFKDVVERLANSGLIVEKEDSKLSLKMSPEKITIWQVVACVSKEETMECDKYLPHQRRRTSIVIMISKEDELLQSIISSRLKRYKLSAWSKKASNIVYI